MLAFHGVFGVYGFWLPNDPRGSWSDFVAAYELFRFGGAATTVTTRRSVAHRRHDGAARRATKMLMKYPAVTFTGQQAQCVGLGIGAVATEAGRVMGHLKRGATERLVAAKLHPFGRGDGTVVRSCWADQGWKVFLDTREDVVRAVDYVERNPVRDGLRRQRWSCVTPS